MCAEAEEQSATPYVVTRYHTLFQQAPINDENDHYLDKILAVAQPIDRVAWAKAFFADEDKAILRKTINGTDGHVFENEVVHKGSKLYVPVGARGKV